MSTTDAVIELSPPLPWVAFEAMGFVIGLGREGLILSVASPLSAPLTGLTVALVDGPPLHIVGTGQPTSDGHVHFHPDAAGIELVADWRGRLRKAQHIAICQTQDVEASDRFTGFEDLHLMPMTLPEIDQAAIDTSVTFLGRRFALPLLITGMTGGIEQGALINRRLARAAARLNIPMGVGSQRIALEHPQHAAIFAVKEAEPDLFLIANLGATQLLDAGRRSLCERAVTMIGADALAIHVNVLQECIQVEGDRDFRGLLAAIGDVCRYSRVPVLVKEVGAGMDVMTARRLVEVGVAGIDVGGRGGTSWGYIEGLRSRDDETRELATTFRNWGIPTAYAVGALRAALPKLPVIATGGIRSGLTVAKAVALGATLAGIGLPLLRAALQNDEAPGAVLATIARGLVTAMTACGAHSLDQLEPCLRSSLPGDAEFRAARREAFKTP